MFMRVHHIAGRIVQVDNCLDDQSIAQNAVSHWPDAEIAIADLDWLPNDRDAFDVATNSYRTMTTAECVERFAPLLNVELRIARYNELRDTDWRESQDGWRQYRQALRDLPTAGDPFDMLNAWPLRPDGADAVAHLKR